MDIEKKLAAMSLNEARAFCKILGENNPETFHEMFEYIVQHLKPEVAKALIEESLNRLKDIGLLHEGVAENGEKIFTFAQAWNNRPKSST